MERDYKKLYEEALKRAKEDYDNVNTSNCERRRLETIFPELIESEDEKIRKALIESLPYTFPWTFLNKQGISQITIKEWLEKQGEHINHNRLEKKGEQNEQSFWEKCNRCKYFDGYDICLHKKNFGTVTDEKKENCKNNGFFIEKQGEQKPIDKVEPMFKVGDWIINNDKRIAIPTQILEIEEYGYVTSMGYTSFDKVKTDYHLWTIEDAKEGDVLYCENHSIEFIVMNKGVNENGNIDSYFRYNSKAGFDIDVSSVLSAYEDIISPATKEQRDLLFQKMKEAGYEWDTEKKELKKIEQESTWSEEDENMFNDILLDMADRREMFKFKGETTFAEDTQKKIDWLSSYHLQLKHQSSCPQAKQEWSEEDEHTLEAIIKEIEANKAAGPEYDEKVYDMFLSWLKSIKERMKGE